MFRWEVPGAEPRPRQQEDPPWPVGLGVSSNGAGMWIQGSPTGGGVTPCTCLSVPRTPVPAMPPELSCVH